MNTLNKFGIDRVLDKKTLKAHFLMRSQWRKTNNNKWGLFIATFLSVPSEASIPLPPYLSGWPVNNICWWNTLYILGPLASYCFFRNHIFWLKTHPFTKYQAEMLTLDETLSWTFGKTMPEKNTNLNFLFSWAESRRLGCNIQKLNAGAWSVWNCAPPQKG